jgi:hypothetical protein
MANEASFEMVTTAALKEAGWDNLALIRFANDERGGTGSAEDRAIVSNDAARAATLESPVANSLAPV